MESAQPSRPLLTGSAQVDVILYKDTNGVEGIYPVYPSTSAACAEVYTPIDLDIPKGSIGRIPLGLGFDVPISHQVTLYPTEELLLKGLLMYVTVIDFDNKDPVFIPCVNFSGGDFHLSKGDIVALAGISIAAQADNWSKRMTMKLHAAPPPYMQTQEKQDLIE